MYWEVIAFTVAAISPLAFALFAFALFAFAVLVIGIVRCSPNCIGVREMSKFRLANNGHTRQWTQTKPSKKILINQDFNS